MTKIPQEFKPNGYNPRTRARARRSRMSMRAHVYFLYTHECVYEYVNARHPCPG